MSKTYYLNPQITVNAATTAAGLRTALATETPQSTVSYTYDAFGRMVKVDDSRFATATSYVYDAEGRLLTETTPQGTIWREYDKLGRVVRLYTGAESIIQAPMTTSAANDGKAITDTRYTYDALGRLKEVKVYERQDTPLSSPEETEYDYDLLSRVSRIQHPVSIVQTYEQQNYTMPLTSEYRYDAHSRLERLIHYFDNTSGDFGDENFELPADWIVSIFDYTHRADGQRTRAVDHLNTDADAALDAGVWLKWRYDDLGRLIEEQLDSTFAGVSYTARYTFDVAGNRLTKTTAQTIGHVIKETTTYTYDENDRLLTETTDHVTDDTKDRHTTYGYGPTTQTAMSVREGLTDQGPLLEQTTYNYDAASRLTSVTIDKTGGGGSVTTTSYGYDDRGLRISQTTGGVVTEYLFDTQNFTGYAKQIEEHVNDVLTRTYTIGHAVLAQYDSANALLILLADGHGSTRSLLSGTGALVQLFAYEAYGETLEATGLTAAANALTPWLRPDSAHDAVTGNEYHIERWRKGHRLLTEDPYRGRLNDPTTLHRYFYSSGNPIMFVDPTGREYTLLGQLVVSGVRAGLLATNLYFGFRAAKQAGLDIINAKNAWDLGRYDVALGWTASAIFNFGLAVLSAWGAASFISAPPAAFGVAAVNTQAGAIRAFSAVWSNPAARWWLLNEVMPALASIWAFSVGGAGSDGGNQGSGGDPSPYSRQNRPSADDIGENMGPEQWNQYGDPSRWRYLGKKDGSSRPATSPKAQPGTTKEFDLYVTPDRKGVEVHYFRTADGKFQRVEVHEPS